MNGKINLKKFLLFLLIFLLVLGISYYIYLKKHKICDIKNNPCKYATCSSCKLIDDNKICNCSIVNKDEERIWVGTCINK